MSMQHKMVGELLFTKLESKLYNTDFFWGVRLIIISYLFVVIDHCTR